MRLHTHTHSLSLSLSAPCSKSLFQPALPHLTTGNLTSLVSFLLIFAMWGAPWNNWLKLSWSTLRHRMPRENMNWMKIVTVDYVGGALMFCLDGLFWWPYTLRLSTSLWLYWRFNLNIMTASTKNVSEFFFLQDDDPFFFQLYPEVFRLSVFMLLACASP